MTDVKSLGIYNSFYNRTPTKNKLKIILKDEQIKELGIDTHLECNVILY